MLKISGVYLIGKPEICQDPPSCGQDDQTLSASPLGDLSLEKVAYLHDSLRVLFQKKSFSVI